MSYLLDTNICIYVINRRPPHVLDRLIEVGRESLAISSVTVAELAFGVAKSTRAGAQAALRRFLAHFPIHDWNEDAAWIYGDVRKALDSKGQRVGERDLLLACQALAMNATMVTNNTREFQRIAGLRLENWAEERG